MRRGLLLGLVALVAASAVSTGAGTDKVATRELLDRYRHGDRRVVVAALSDGRELRSILGHLTDLVTEAGGPAAPRPDRLAAAGLALETAALLWWPADIDPFIEFGCGLLQSDPPDEIERRWQLAATAAFLKGRDDGFLVIESGFGKTLGARTWPPGRPDHLAHAQQRFPSDARLKFAAAIAAAVTADSEPARDEVWASKPVGAEAIRRTRVLRAIAMFEELTRASEIAAEAEVRIGQLQLALHAPREALPHLTRGRGAADPFVAYLAHFLSGRALDRLDRHAEAQDEYQAALVVMPHVQSASEAYAANAFLDGRRDVAYALIADALAARPRPQDPWRRFGYGDARLLPERLEAFHEAIR